MEFLDVVAQKEIERVTQYALTHRLDLAMVKAIAAGTHADISNNPLRVAHLPRGFVATYAIEEHPGGWYNHVVVSLNGSRPPQPVAFAIAIFICRPNGPEKLVDKSEACCYNSPDGKAINVLLPFVEKPEDKRIITLTA